MSWKNPMFGDRHLVLNGNNNELKETCIFIFFCKKEKEMCPLLIGILSFYKHIFPRNIRLIFEVREKNVLLHFLIIILIWEMATTQKCFTHIDWHFAMTANLPLRVLFHHRDVFHFCKNITMDNNCRERNERKVFIWQLKQ